MMINDVKELVHRLRSSDCAKKLCNDAASMLEEFESLERSLRNQIDRLENKVERLAREVEDLESEVYTDGVGAP